ncbi:hypothetical protein BRARA_I04899 [Brassica rapa]|uniref:Uncharacterized protein n=1 Tax=Brassica campestris TaxID=3711 RepID=A0A397Y986_BRACM|nr:hypothetical protein BRARA_I04899 [Brassica rapa]
MAALRFGDAFRPPPLPPVTPRAPTPTRKMSMLLSSSRFMSLIVTSAIQGKRQKAPWACSWSCSKLIDGLSFWESDEMGKQRTKRKKMNNAIHPLSISDLSFGGFAATVPKPNVCMYICV